MWKKRRLWKKPIRRSRAESYSLRATGKVADDKLAEAVDKVFDLRPAAIINTLELRKPQYRQLAAYGHMGREDLGVAWERTDKVEELKKVVN